MEVLLRPPGAAKVGSVGLLAGGFNPPTLAHLALVEAARAAVDEVICVVPRIYPHKVFHGATLDERIAMLQSAAGSPVLFGVAIAEQGLFIDIARECRVALGSHFDVHFVCGRDAAERIVGWDYGEVGTIEKMMEEFGLLVAQRAGAWIPPERLAHRVRSLGLPSGYDEMSSTEVRHRLERGDPWTHLVPPGIISQVRSIFAKP